MIKCLIPINLKKKYTTIPNWSIMLLLLQFTHSQYLNYVALVMAKRI